ncbi:unnamed protein product [Paramecium primaurelia]|uniref:Uncharacterized protein n=2 Tax=Paramecium TaxID=5884 RepID=A0A8S1YF63_9CILI|nr:unnamed protein product [Paramecium primaurelia]CAD8212480.1 unnamed protein product [Paramecium pentaurelia]
MKIIALVLVGLLCVSAETQTRSPGQLLVDHINSLILSIRNEQTEHDDIYTVQQRECGDELGFRKKEVQDAVDALTRATEHKGRAQAAHASATADLIRVKTYQQILEDQVEFITTRRNDRAANFNKKVQNINTSLSLIDGAEQIVNEFANASASFIQVTKHFNNMFLQATKAGNAGEYAPLLSVLVELSGDGNVSVDNINRIRQLLNELREKLSAALSQLTDNENTQIEVFQARKNRVQDVITLLVNVQGQLTAYIAQLQATITKEEDIINSATSKRIRNQNLLNYASDMCNAFNTEYNDSTGARRKEVELLTKLRTFVEQRVEEFNQYGGDPTDVFASYAKQGSAQAAEAQFLQLRANLRARK